MSSTAPALTRGSVLGHLVRLAIPAATGMIFNTLYNLTDYWFAGLLSDEALAGVSIAGSVFFLILSLGMGIQTGTSAVIAPEVGAGRENRVSSWIDNVIGLSLVISLLAIVIGWFAAEPLVKLLGAEAHIAPLALDYVWIVLLGSAGFILSFAAAGALMALGDTQSNRNALAAGFLFNFVLNPLLIFWLDLGIRGLALATVIIKVATAVYLFRVLAKRLGRRHRPRFDSQYWLALARQVFPASFNMLTIVLGGFITVSLIGRFGSEHVAGYSVGLRLEQVLLLPALGLNSAVMALAGQNYGAGLMSRVEETYRVALRSGFVMALVSMPIMVFLSPAMMQLFTRSAEIASTGATYLRIDAIAFFGYVVVFQSVAILQSLKQPLFPMFMGIARQLVVPATINYLLVVVWGYPMLSVFYTIVTVVLVAAFISHWYTSRQLRYLITQKTC